LLYHCTLIVNQCPFPDAGAGDTFNAAVIGSLLGGRTLEESVQLACQVGKVKSYN